MMSDQNCDALYPIAKAFYQAYRLTGVVKIKFSVRSIADSDGNSVVEVYLSPRDEEAASTLNLEDHSRHMQFLESMVPSNLLGYQFILKISPMGVDDIELEVLNVVEPVTYTSM
ncbi:hypothetical protein [Vampirovibrio sp.]|uniref:hypothetical protein n=1 Tax=Vampirovibrio sp. TaxID=2717857 RepID=UPI0035940481